MRACINKAEENPHAKAHCRRVRSTPATLSYAGLAGGFVGPYEFYITVPSPLADGDYPIIVMLNGTPVPQTIYLTVQN